MRYEIGLTILPEALGKRLDALIARRHPWITHKNELRRTIILDALGEYLDREEHGPGSEVVPNYPISKGTEYESKITHASYKTAEEAIND